MGNNSYFHCTLTDRLRDVADDELVVVDVD